MAAMPGRSATIFCRWPVLRNLVEKIAAIGHNARLMSKRRPFTDQDALDFHSQGKPGKLEIIASKPMTTQRDLSLAYSPGVAVPVRAIAEDPSKAYDYTSKGNLVAVISNGTAAARRPMSWPSWYGIRHTPGTTSCGTWSVGFNRSRTSRAAIRFCTSGSWLRAACASGSARNARTRSPSWQRQVWRSDRKRSRYIVATRW